MSIDRPNWGWSSTHSHQLPPAAARHARHPPSSSTSLAAPARRQEDAQPNLDEGKNLRPAHFVIGRKEPEPAPPEVLASNAIRPGGSNVAGRSQAAARAPHVPTAPRNMNANLNPAAKASNPNPNSNSNPGYSSALAEPWPQRGQNTAYNPASMLNHGYTSYFANSSANTAASIPTGPARLTDQGQAYRSPSNTFAAPPRSVATGPSGTRPAPAQSTPRLPPLPPLPTSHPAPSSTQAPPAGLFRPPANVPSTVGRPSAATHSTSDSLPRPSSSVTAPNKPTSNGQPSPALFRPRSSSPADVKPDRQALQRAEASTSAAAGRLPEARPGQTLSNGHSATPISRPAHGVPVHQGAAPVGPGPPATPVHADRSVPTGSGSTSSSAPALPPSYHREVFPLPFECRSDVVEGLTERVRAKRDLLVQSLCEDLEIQHGRPIVSSSTHFFEEEVEVVYYFEPLRENEVCIRLPVSLRRSNAHFAGSVTAARESFKLEQVAGAAVQGKMAKEARFTYAHFVMRFGDPTRSASRSSSAVPLRSSLPPSGSAQSQRTQQTQQQNAFAVPALPRVKMEASSPQASARAGTFAAGARDSDMRPPSPPAPPPREPVAFPLNAKPGYADVQLTRKNVDAYLQNFLDRFENKRSGGRLVDFYSNEASFSYTDLTGPSTVNGKDMRTELRACGQWPITNILKKLPVCTFARDAEGKIFYDATRVGVSTNPLAFLPILVNMHGSFKELERGVERSFSRILYLNPVHNGPNYGGAAGLQYTILSDQVFVRPYAPHRDWFIGKLPLRKPTPPGARPAPAPETGRRPFVREQSIILPAPQLHTADVQRAIAEAASQGMARSQSGAPPPRLSPAASQQHRPTSNVNGIGRSAPAPSRTQFEGAGLPTASVPQAELARLRESVPASDTAAMKGRPESSRTQPGAATPSDRPRPKPSAPAPVSASSSAETSKTAATPSTSTGKQATAPRATAGSTPAIPAKRAIIEIDDSDDEGIPENERLVSQASTVRAGPADARRVKQRMQEKFAGAPAGPAPRATVIQVPEAGAPPASTRAQAQPQTKKARAPPAPKVPNPQPPIPFNDPDTGVKYTKVQRRALRKAMLKGEVDADSPDLLKKIPGPDAFTFGQQSTVPHDMHGLRNKARKMFELKKLGGYLSVNFRGNLYYWKGDQTFPGPACIDREADERLQVDDCIWSEKFQTAILGYAGPSSAEPRPTTQLTIIRADEASVDDAGEMTGLRREILDATPHDKLGITSLALVDFASEKQLSFVSAGNDRKISLWTVPKDGRQNVRCRAIPTTHTSRIASMVWKHHGQHLVTGGMDKRLCLMDLGAGKSKTVQSWKETQAINHVLLHKNQQVLLCFLSFKDQFKYIDLRAPESTKTVTFGRQLGSNLGQFTHGEWRGNLFAYAFEDVVTIWDIRNTSKPREEKFGTSGVIQPHFESDTSLALLEKKHFTKVSYSYAAQ